MRLFSFRRWRARELFGSWVAYWVLLAIATLTPAALAIWRATRAAPDTGNVNVSISNTLISLTVTVAKQTTWTGSIHVLALALLIAGPPMVIWLAWVMTRRRAEEVREVV